MAATSPLLLPRRHHFEKPDQRSDAILNPFYLYLQTRHMSSTARRRQGERRRRGIRTGCMLCLAKGVRCDKTNPACVKRVSTKWKSDLIVPSSSTPSTTSPSAPTAVDETALAIPHLSAEHLSFTSPTVRWNERQSLHFYIDFTAPQLAGSFGSSFWQEMVIRAAYHEQMILHALVGMGSLHEAIVQSRSQSELQRHGKYTFALRHINEAIKHAQSETNRDKAHLNSIQTLCIILTTFEAMQGQTKSAIQHAFQGIKLMLPHDASDELPGVQSVALDTTIDNRDNHFPVSKTTISSIFNYFTSVATLFSTELSPLLFYTPHELPPRFASLTEAEQTLRDAKSTITMLFLLTCRLPTHTSRTQSANRMRRYQPWIKQWKSSFDGFLVEHENSLSPQEMQQALILKANHLFCFVSANVEYAGLSTAPIASRYEPFNDIFAQIMDICEEVIKYKSRKSSPTVLSAKNTYLSYGMWILEPLYMAANYSTDGHVKQRAVAILTTQPRPEHFAHSGPYAGKDIIEEAKELSYTSSAKIRERSDGVAYKGEPL
ncbi:hypothetical protein CAC42_2941 [Sphaceloma murrayae]|uniref:Zn(2)-C6 fungal-type domain-containing protein n=1 Tax=Sphaceloma murrayae TaxID=2082308 RepID=A0A2K1R099_9PEZI|nr:hypothetical protein CAC42_2941 [Sphaceloma murrayae]